MLAGAPEVVADRSPLPYCGATLLSPNTGVNPFPAIELVDDAVDCYRARAEAGQPAEMVEIGWTTEGDPILHIRRLLPDGREETFSDMTRDAFGIRAWFRLVCPRYQPLEGTCEPVEQLPLGELAGPSTTLFDITTADAETGPPFYLDAEPLTPGESDVWATHELTITSEWRTPIAVAIPPTEFVLDSRQLNGAPEGQLQSEPTVLQPGESLRLVLELKPRFPDGPVAGVYEIEVPLSYWRNVDAAVGPTGPPENTLTLNIRYDVLDARTVSAIETFCDRAVETAADLTKIDQELLTDGLDTIEAAAVELPQQRGEQLVTEIQALRLRLDTWFSPDPGHSGFSTGPIIDITDTSVLAPPFGITTALVLQYTGFHATQELQTFSIWNRAENLADFQAGLDQFDVGSQNWAYADTAGNLAYFSSAEMPLRTDLESGAVAGLPPFFVRDGASGLNNWIDDPAKSQGQAIPFEILPFAEMPQTVNPANDFFVNANNDPAGTTLDNDPLNQTRTGNPGAIYYLNPGYALGLRAGRITRLIEDEIASGKVSFQEMKEFQANTQQLDAELLVPFLTTAFTNASEAGAPAQLAALAGDPEIVEAVGRLALWDFSTPTGLDEGYDASDFHGHRIPLHPHGGGSAEIDASVAATIYNMWRGFAVRNIVDARLAGFGLGAGSSEALKALHNLLDQSPYTGVAAAGIDWIPLPAALSAEDRRDLALLQALRDALDQLASNDLAPAFANSTDQSDYRWGKLHRIRFDHPFEDAFDIPPQGGFDDLAPDLPGVARDGGYNVVNASGFSARATGLNSFMFGGGPVRRYVGKPFFGRILGVNVVPGGPSGIPGDSGYATQLATWLTADYHLVNMTRLIPGEKEELVPPAP